MSVFTERVFKLMERDNISQKQLSELSHISEASISRYLSGKSQPRMDIASNIAKIFGVSTSYILGETDQESQKDAYNETLCIVARNKTKLTDEQKANIIKLLFGGK
jgi:transcriptional regulator with XRE-family HTH domain